MTEWNPVELSQPDLALRIQQALAAAHDKLKAIDDARREPIAVIGIGCRFPGADNPERFWELLREGGDAVHPISSDRWAQHRLYDPQPAKPGHISFTHAALLEGIDQFDPHFFGISPREADAMDPQQRLLLEVGWEALEHACIPPTSLKNHPVGLYIGIGQQDYARLELNCGNLDAISAYSGTGCLSSFAPGRLAYALGFQGPTMAVDTACSSSLVAVHLACAALRAGEAELALAGGVHLALTAEMNVFLSMTRSVAPDGRSKAFDAAADGFGRGEGCGVIVLKRLSKARADGDAIHGLILGSAVNHDGPSGGLTVPSSLAQEKVIREALERARIAPHQIQMVETHGTGTALGDPIEVDALASVLCKNREAGQPLILGALKTNIGHLEAASGIAGLIKLLLAMKAGTIPANLHFHTPNPRIRWDLPLKVPKEAVPWPHAEQRLAGVSSFGMSGVNAHIVLGSSAEKCVKGAIPADRREDEFAEYNRYATKKSEVLALSAKSEAALQALIERHLRFLRLHKPELADFCYSANAGRSHFSHRLAVLAFDCAELERKLETYLAGEPVDGLFRGESADTREPFRKSPDSDAEALARAYVRGQAIDWNQNKHLCATKIPIPTYPFERQRHWVQHQLNPSDSALIGRPIHLPFSSEFRYEARIQAATPRHLADHKLFDAVVVAAASQLAFVIEGARQAFGETALELRNSSFSRTIPLSATPYLLHLIIGPRGAEGHPWQIVGASDSQSHESAWNLHAQGLLHIPATTPLTRSTIAHFQPPTMTSSDFYAAYLRSGYQFGPLFRWGHAHRFLGASSSCELHPPQTLSQEADARRYRIHPGLLDSCFQLAGCFWPTGPSQPAPEGILHVPFQLTRLCLLQNCPSDTRLDCFAERVPLPGDAFESRFQLSDIHGQVLLEVEGFALQPAPREWLLARGEAPCPSPNAGRTPDPALDPNLAHVSDPALLHDPSSPFLTLDWQSMPQDLIPLVGPKSPNAPPGEEIKLLLLAAPQQDLTLVAHELQKEGFFVLSNSSGLAFQTASEALLLEADAVLDFRWLALKELDGLEAACLAWLELIRLCADLSLPPRLFHYTCAAQRPLSQGQLGNPVQAALWGLARVLASEHPELKCQLIDLPPQDLDQPPFGRCARRAPALPDPAPSAASNAPQLTPASPIVPLRLLASSSHTLEQLRFAPILPQPPLAGQVQIRVHAAALNFKDLLHALGQLPHDPNCALGLECAGRITALGAGVTDFRLGQAVIALLAPGSLADSLTLSADRVFPKPEGLDFESAAACPLVYLTAAHALDTLGKLQPGQDVLIHSAAGGVGLAAVQIAHRRGARVHATASPGKWDYLRTLGVQSLANSRNLDFAKTFRDATGGRGVDLVLNALSGDFIPAGLDLLASGGLFVEIGKLGIWEPAQVAARRPDIRYQVFDLQQLWAEDPQPLQRSFQLLLQEFDHGRLSPPLLEVHEFADAHQAFRRLAQARHKGKVVIRLHRDREEHAKRDAQLAQSQARQDAHQCLRLPTPDWNAAAPLARADGNYLITGGLGALGLRTAEWLVEQGAKRLTLVGRTATRALASERHDTLRRIEQLRTAGIEVEVRDLDLADPDAVATLFARLRLEPRPLRGIVHAAGVLADATLLRIDRHSLEKVLAPKVRGAWLLHEHSKDLPLDFFLLYSSAAALLGSPGQGAYAAANAFLDSLSRTRRAMGLPSLSVGWGPWAEIGMAAMSESQGSGWSHRGLLPIPPQTALSWLDPLIRSGVDQLAAVRLDLARFAASCYPKGLPHSFDRLAVEMPAPAAAQTQAPPSETPQPGAVSAAPADPTQKRLAQLLDEASDQERLALALARVQQTIAKVLGSQVQRIQPRHRLFDLGLDSLMAIELKNELESDLGQKLRQTLVFDYPTPEALAAYLEGEWQKHRAKASPKATEKPQLDLPQAPPSEAAFDLEALLAEADNLSEDEITKKLTDHLG